MPAKSRYKLQHKIADGGMAEIYLGIQRGAEGFERPVVLKRILPHLLSEPQFKNLMIDEAHVAMTLLHSNVVQVLDLGQAKGRYYLVLEFVDGWDLNRILNRLAETKLVLPPSLALFIASEVCRALAYAHAKTRNGEPMGIVHRDVSPHNVLVSEQGEVKLTDFGIAKAMVRRENTVEGVIKGKLAFMSPEQASGNKLDHRSDLFSVGTLLYLMTTGQRPFTAPTDLETIFRVQQCQYPPPRDINKAIPASLAKLISRSMALQPSKRFPNAESMLDAIEDLQRRHFEPAGKTELKRWLAELERLDGIPSIGRAALLRTSSRGTIELDQSDIEFEMPGEAPRRPRPSLPPPRKSASLPARPPTGSVRPPLLTERSALDVPQPVPSPADSVDPEDPLEDPLAGVSVGFQPTHESIDTAAARRAQLGAQASAPVDGKTGRAKSRSDDTRRRQKGLLVTVAVVLIGTLATWYLAQRENKPQPDVGAMAHKAGGAHQDKEISEPPQRQDADIHASASEPGPGPSQAPGDSAEERGLFVGRPAVPAASERAQEADDSEADDSKTGETSSDQATDLASRIASKRGADTGATAPEKNRRQKAAQTTPAKTPKTQRQPRPAPKPALVNVRIESVPTGALVEKGTKALGRTPLRLRLPAGTTQQLRFKKPGFIAVKKSYRVTRQKTQRVQQRLRKRKAAPAQAKKKASPSKSTAKKTAPKRPKVPEKPKRGLLQRLFD